MARAAESISAPSRDDFAAMLEESFVDRAPAEGAVVNVDNLDEIVDLETIAKKLNRTVHVGMRLNLDAGIYPQWSRFGFNLESGQALDAAKRMARGGKLKLNGLHCHIGTFIMDPQAYAREITKIVKFGYELRDAFGCEMEYYDIGGGFPSKSRLKGVYLPPEVAIPGIDEFAEAITHAFSDALKPGDFPKLIVESGRALIDEAGYLVTSIVAAKRLADGTRVTADNLSQGTLYLLAILALGLVTSHDLEKLSSLKVREPWLARLRDVVVGATIRVALVFEPRRPA